MARKRNKYTMVIIELDKKNNAINPVNTGFCGVFIYGLNTRWAYYNHFLGMLLTEFATRFSFVAGVV